MARREVSSSTRREKQGRVCAGQSKGYLMALPDYGRCSAYILGLEQWWLKDCFRRYRAFLFCSLLIVLVVSGVVIWRVYPEWYESKTVFAESANPVLRAKGLSVSEETVRLLKGNRLFRVIYPDWKTPPEDRIQVYKVPESNLVSVVLRARQPEQAQKQLEAYLKHYETLVKTMALEPLNELRGALEHRLARSYDKLAAMDQSIAAFKASEHITDVQVTAKALASEMASVHQQLNQVQVKLALTQTKLQHTRQALGHSTKMALQDLDQLHPWLLSMPVTTKPKIAQGIYPLTYSPLLTPPLPSEQQVQSVSLFEPPPKVDLASLQARLKTADWAVWKEARQEILTRFVMLKSEMSGLTRQSQILEAQLRQLKTQVQHFSQTELTLKALEEERQAQAGKLAVLNQKFHDTEAAILAVEHRRLRVLEAPSRPFEPVFPNRLHVLSGVMTISAFLLMAGILIVSRCQDDQVFPAFVARMLQAPVLAVIPRVNLHTPSSLDASITEAHSAAFREWVLNIKLRSRYADQRILAFAGIHELEMQNLAVVPLWARFLKERGERIFTLTVSDAIVERSSETFLDMVKAFTQARAETTGWDAQAWVSQYFDARLPQHLVSVEMLKASEWFRTEAFSELMAALKQQFDWVFLELPAMLDSDSFFYLDGKIEGLVVMVDAAMSRRKVTRILGSLGYGQLPIIGAVLVNWGSHEETVWSQDIYQDEVVYSS